MGKALNRLAMACGQSPSFRAVFSLFVIASFQCLDSLYFIQKQKERRMTLCNLQTFAKRIAFSDPHRLPKFQAQSTGVSKIKVRQKIPNQPFLDHKSFILMLRSIFIVSFSILTKTNACKARPNLNNPSLTQNEGRPAGKNMRHSRPSQSAWPFYISCLGSTRDNKINESNTICFVLKLASLPTSTRTSHQGPSFAERRKLVRILPKVRFTGYIIIISESPKHCIDHEIGHKLSLQGIEVGVVHELEGHLSIVLPWLLLGAGRTGRSLGFRVPWLLTSTGRRQASFPLRGAFLILLFIVFFSYIFFEILDNNFGVSHLLKQLLVMAAALKGVSGAYELCHSVEDPRLPSITKALLSLLLGTHHGLILFQEINVEQILVEGPRTHRPVPEFLRRFKEAGASIIGGLTHFSIRNKRL